VNPLCGQLTVKQFKSLLLSVPVLMAPDFAKSFKLMVDASDVGGGAVLLQENENGIDHPVCYFHISLISTRRIIRLVKKRLLPYYLLYSISEFIWKPL